VSNSRSWRELTPAALRRSISDRIRNAARQRDRTATELHREFYLQRFLARVFATQTPDWLLKGGASLVARNSQARYSTDIDLLHMTARLDHAVRQLIEIAGGTSELDPFRFVIGQPKTFSGATAGASLRVDVYVGAAKFADFSIDVSTERLPVGDVDHVSPPPVIEIDSLEALPDFALYPLPQQFADKVCAMYEVHNDQPSTRYRDLVDLAEIVSNWELDAATTKNALDREAERRSLKLPLEIVSPGDGWAVGYANAVRRVKIVPASAHGLEGALELVGRFFNPLQARTVAEGTWRPADISWSERTP
jgi:Nucleotidyl transferase AbiEii toxin, Type IV TA system